MAHVIKTLQDNLGDGEGKTPDPFVGMYGTPPVLARLLESKSLGQKTGAGFYKKVGREVMRLDPETLEYVSGGAKANEVVGRMLKKPAPERLKLLRHAEGAEVDGSDLCVAEAAEQMNDAGCFAQARQVLPFAELDAVVHRANGLYGGE
eukprot:gene18877-37998_t